MTKASIAALRGRVASLQLRRDTIRSEIHSLEEKAEKARLAYMNQRDIANEKASQATAHITQLSEEIAAAQIEVDVEDFFKVSKELDDSGETPALLAQWKKLTGALRSGGRIGQSHEVVLSILSRLQGKGAPLPIDMLSYSGIAKKWVREPKHESRIHAQTVTGSESREREAEGASAA
jgi:hypothetical protein